MDQTSFGNTRVYYGDSTELLYLRSRYYSSGTGRFLTRDTWTGDYHKPQSFNWWNYGYSNPVNNIDPTGNSSCHTPLPTSCQNGLAYVSGFASAIKGFVESGSLMPVEGFAMLADLSKSHFNGDIRDLLWAMTIVLNNFDANRGSIWLQVDASPISVGSAQSPYFIGENWLPYMHNPDPSHNPRPWCDPQYLGDAKHCIPDQWTHSLRGDWSKKYWDKTANQAYHFWFYVAVTFFDGRGLAEFANNYHDNPFSLTNYDFSGSQEGEAPPPYNVPSRPDRDLAFQGMALAEILRSEYDLQEWYGDCDMTWIIPTLTSTNLGSWIRSHLK